MAAAGDDILELVRAFLAAPLDGAPPPRIDRVERITVGRSRENWVFDAVWPPGTDLGDGPAPSEVTEPLIVRRDPLGGLLETSRADEFAVLRALESTAVPTPRARWLDPDGSQLGRPSLVMRREPGVCDYFVVNGDRPLAERLELAQRFCDLLGSIHTVDWAAAGLGRVFADPGPEAARAEVDHWQAILQRDQLEPYPELALAAGWLRAHAPRSQRTVLVHGDFKPGNVLLDDGRIVALLDWELAHLGDPMEDLGWITQPLRLREHLIPGAWDREQLFARYTAATGIAVDEASVAWWNVLASYKTAVMQVSGLRSFLEGRSDEPYRPTAAVYRSLLDAVSPIPTPTVAAGTAATTATAGQSRPDPSATVSRQVAPVPPGAEPVVDQHLRGARRLLEAVAADPGLSPASAAMVADVRRLLRQSASAWAAILPFLIDDNRRLDDLLAQLTDVPATPAASTSSPTPNSPASSTSSADSTSPTTEQELDVAAAQARNRHLRGQLAEVVGRLSADRSGDTARAAVAAHLRRRLDVDPLNARPAPNPNPNPNQGSPA